MQEFKFPRNGFDSSYVFNFTDITDFCFTNLTQARIGAQGGSTQKQDRRQGQ